MTEIEMLSEIKALVDPHIKGYQLAIIGRKIHTISKAMVTAAVICKEDAITPDLILDIFDYQQKNDEEIEFVETSKDIQDLKFDVIILQAKIKYVKGT